MAIIKNVNVQYSEFPDSDLVLGNVNGSDLGYPFETATIVVTETLKRGSVVNDLGVEVTSASASTASGVFIRTDANLKTVNVGDSITAVIVRRGATLNKFLLKFTDGDINDAGVKALEAKGLKVTAHFFGK